MLDLIKCISSLYQAQHKNLLEAIDKKNIKNVH